ncbi:hypothetical protein Mnod_2268 [Methylobacterium nodulans ORS 2060]|uniref:Uncharacterized protein n=1 Tax=Methylobacterium nodulans (strain LMG 21967 / CNCM I-2342 / ORS 2060) TaxID=460265 RepID=B8IA20_METNO|nr:hypothetical protein [Methylobacterium nodulans]ACL57248.1 hypothetical protein Mnod_2268 [Methylobacterium nodulans ORS 2060]
MNPFHWFRPQLDEPQVEPSWGARLRLARAEQQHRRLSCDLIRVALDEVDRTAAEMGTPVVLNAAWLQQAVAELRRRYLRRTAGSPGGA